MTRLGRMLFDDGKVEGERIGEERGESKIMTLIQRMTADGALGQFQGLRQIRSFIRPWLKNIA